MRHALYWVACAVVAANLPLSVARAVANPDAYRPGFALATLVGIGGLLVWAVWRTARWHDAVTPLRGIAVLSWVAVALHPWAIRDHAVGYPPLFHVLGAGLCISAVFGVRVALFVVPPFAAVVASVRAPYLGWSQAIGEACLLALSGGLAAACVDVVRRAGRTVIQAVDELRRLEEEEWRSARRSYERENWDGLLHDKVLGALRIARRSPDSTVPEAARELAAAALAAFRGDPAPSAQPPAQVWAGHARRLGLTVHLEVDGELRDGEVASAIVDAVNEALTNVARHSGGRQASVVATLREDRAEVTVQDRGRGFVVRPDRFGDGLRTSIVGRMRAVGGTAEVLSAPDAGTTVALAWRARPPTPPHAVSRWRNRAFVPVMLLGALVMVANVVMGHAQWSQARYPVLVPVGVAAIVSVSVVVALAPPTVRTWGIPAAVMTVIAAAMAANTAPGAVSDWRYWYLGALTPAVATVSYRFRSGVGLSTVSLVTLAVMGVDAANGFPPWASLAGPVPVMVGSSLAGHLFRQALDRAWQRVSEATENDARLRLAIAVDEEHAREAGHRVAALADAVGPTLGLLLTEPTITPGLAARLSRLEAATRDHLAAPDLLDSALVQALGSARARGLRVDVVSTRSDPLEDQRRAGPGHPGGRGDSGNGTAARGRSATTVLAADHQASDVDVYRSLLVELLACAPARTRVRAVWRPQAGLRDSTLSAVGPGLHRVEQRLRRVTAGSPPGARPRITGDEDSLLVEFDGTSSAPGVLDAHHVALP